MFQIRKKYAKYQGFLPGIGILFVSIFCITVIFVPAIQTIITMYTDLLALQKETQSLQKKVNVLASLDEYDLEQKFQLSVSALPTDRSLPTIVQTVDGVSAQAGVLIRELTLASRNSLSTQSAETAGVRDKETGAFVIPFSVEIAGDFEQLRNFLNLSTVVRRLVKAKSFSLNLTDDGQLKTTVQFETYFSPLTPNASAKDATAFSSEEMDILGKIEQFSVFEQEMTTDTATPPLPEEQKTNPFSL